MAQLGFALTCAMAQAQDATVVKEIVVNGAKEVSQDAIFTAMRTKVGRPFLQSQLDQDRQAIEDMGFFKAVDVRGKPLNETEWQIIVDVVEYDRILEIRVAGNDEKAVKNDDILKAMGLKVGGVYNLKLARQDTKTIEDLYSKKGYFARVADLGPLEDSPGTLNVAIVLLTVNQITVEGNTKTQDRVIGRLIKTRPGDTFSLPKWQRDLRRMFETQWFESIDPTQSEPELGKLDLKVGLKETRTGNVDFGVQVDPRSNFAGLIRFRDTNFKGTGQYWGLEFLQATTGRGLSVGFDYGNPFIDSKDTALNLSVYSRESYRFSGGGFGSTTSPTGDNYSERRTGAQIGLSRPLNDYLNVSAGVKYETIRTLGADDALSGSFIQQDGSLGTLTLAATLNRRDVDIDPSRGDWLRLSVEPGFSKITSVGGLLAGSSRLGRSDFVRTYLEYRRYFTDQPPRAKFDDPRRVLAFRLRYGRIDGGDVPFYEQYFAGGANSLRGYSDDRFWGRETAGVTMEYRYPIQKSFNVIGHMDYAGAWNGYPGLNEFRQYKKPQFFLGYGVGFSFKTPLGPIRLDFSFNKEGGSRTHFLIGSNF